MTVTAKFPGQWNPSYSGKVEPSRVEGVSYYPVNLAWGELAAAGLVKRPGCFDCCFNTHDEEDCNNHYCSGGIFLSQTHIVALVLEK